MEQQRTVRKKKRRPAGKGSRKRRSGISLKGLNIKFIAGVVVMAALVIGLVFMIKGCSAGNKTPEKTVKTLINAYIKGNEKKILKCYDVKKPEEELQKEVSSTIQYFEAHKPEKAKIDACGTIYKNGKNAYVYIIYSLILENKQSYPCINTYMTEQKEDGRYYVLSSSEITDEMKKEAAEQYASFMKSDPYKKYVTAYETFTKKNPGYEEKLATKLR